MQSIIRDLFAATNLTATAGTVISALMQARSYLKSWIAEIQYTAGTTAHTITIMKPQGLPVKLTAAAASGQSVIALSALPTVASSGRALAANDTVVLQQPDNSQVIGVVSSVSGLNVTLNANLANALNSGAKVWFYGLATDGHAQVSAPASATTKFGSDTTFVGVAGADRENEPIIVQSNNATAAGTFVQINGVYLATTTAR